MIIQITQHNCVQFVIYSKSSSGDKFSQMIISYKELIQYANDRMKYAFNAEKKFEEFLKMYKLNCNIKACVKNRNLKRRNIFKRHYLLQKFRRLH